MTILIVGAGLAGLTCARLLAERGLDVTLVEASDGIGGRVRSDTVAGFTLDRGFQVLFDSYPAVRRLLDLRTLDLRRFDPGALICCDGRRAILTDPLRDTDRAAALAAALSTVISPGDKLKTLLLALALRAQTIDEVLAGDDDTTLNYLRRQKFSERTIDVFFRPFYGGIFLDRSLMTSAKCFKFDFKLLAEGAACVPARGMGEIARQLAAPIADRVRLGSPASELLSDGMRVTGMRLAGGETLLADAVVLAVPAPEAARLSGLDTPQGALSTITLYFRGERPVWRGKKLALNAAPDAFVNNAQMLSNVAPEYAPPGQQLLGATVLGAPQLDDAALYRAALADIHRMFAGDDVAQAALASYQPLALYRIPYAQFRQPPGFQPTLPGNRSGRPGLYFAAEFTEASSLNAAMISGELCAVAVAADRSAWSQAAD